MVDEIQDHERYSLAFSKARSHVGEATLLRVDPSSENLEALVHAKEVHERNTWLCDQASTNYSISYPAISEPKAPRARQSLDPVEYQALMTPSDTPA